MNKWTKHWNIKRRNVSDLKTRKQRTLVPVILALPVEWVFTKMQFTHEIAREPFEFSVALIALMNHLASFRCPFSS